jgi:hypothetical protein
MKTQSILEYAGILLIISIAHGMLIFFDNILNQPFPVVSRILEAITSGGRSFNRNKKFNYQIFNQ